jgi:putative transposase
MQKEITKTYKYRLYPNKYQIEMFDKYFGCVRFVYNKFLFERKKQYQETGKSDNYYGQAKALTLLKKDDNYSWLKDINSQVLQCSLRHLESAYTNFFQGRAKFPVFKKKKSKNSFTVPQNVKFENGKLYIPKFKEAIKVVEHRQLQGKILFATISKTPTNKYYVSITVKQEYNSKKPTCKEVGIDLGIKDLVITSNGEKFKNNKYLLKYEKELKKAQQHLSRKKNGSNRYEKQRLKVALIHEKIANCRSDVLHKISHKLVMQNDVVYLENLNIKGLSRSNLAKSVNDCSWGELTRQLHYKGDWDDTYIHEINRFYPSSKTCHSCGYIKQDLILSDREWVCPSCNTRHDRDINASINILLEGKREISVGTTDNTRGEDIRPQSRKRRKANLNETRSSLL